MKNLPLKTVVKQDVHDDFKSKANGLGMSVNQYLKLLVLRDLGIEPPEGETYADLPKWLRGK